MPDITREAVERLSKIYLAKVRYHRTKNPYYKEPSQSQITSDTLLAMADRIEELEAKLRSSALQELSALGQASEAYQAQLAAEARLAKAVAQMQRVKDFRYDPNIGIELNLLEATLAELKGETDA